MAEEKKKDDVVKTKVANAAAFMTLALGAGLGAGTVLGIMTLIPDAFHAQKHLRDVLADREKTDLLIKKLQSEPVTQEFLDDPEAMKNLKRLTEAVEGHVRETLENRIKHLHQTKDLIESTTPKKDWANKVFLGRRSDAERGRLSEGGLERTDPSTTWPDDWTADPSTKRDR